MPSKVVFIDTSVLLKLLDVSKNNEDREADLDRLLALQDSGATLVLPMTTIIETGNAIVRDAGGRTRECSKRFTAIIEHTLQGNAPWVASGVGFTHEVLDDLIKGLTPFPPLLDLMTSGIGTGDAAILAEVTEFRSRVPGHTPVEVWTHDRRLGSYV